MSMEPELEPQVSYWKFKGLMNILMRFLREINIHSYNYYMRLLHKYCVPVYFPGDKTNNEPHPYLLL